MEGGASSGLEGRLEGDRELRASRVGDAHLGGEDLVDDTVVLSFLGRHEEVTVAVVLDLLDRLAGVVGNVLAEERPDEEDLLGLISMSAAWPWAPPSGWWIMMRLLGRLRRLPLVPAPRRKAPIEAAVPKHTVLVSHGTNCIVSKMAMPAETEPPGELMYMVMSWLASSFAR